MSTPHNNAKKGDIAKTVLMPGDPLRARFIAENYLDSPVCYNEVRGMLGFTGTYKGVPVSVQGSGMGMPSIGIYSWELFNEYEVENIIRVGTAGAVSDSVALRDVIIGISASTNSNYTSQYRPARNLRSDRIVAAHICRSQGCPDQRLHLPRRQHLLKRYFL